MFADSKQEIEPFEVKNAKLDDLPNAEYIKEVIAGTIRWGSMDRCYNVFVKTNNFKLYRFPNDDLKMVTDVKLDQVCNRDGFLKNSTFECTNVHIFEDKSRKKTDPYRVQLQIEEMECGMRFPKPWQHGMLLYKDINERMNYVFFHHEIELIREIKSLDPNKDEWGRKLTSKVMIPAYDKLFEVNKGCNFRGPIEGFGLKSKKIAYGYEYKFSFKNKISCDGGKTEQYSTCKNIVVHQLFDSILGMLPEYQKILNDQKPIKERKEKGM